MLKHFSEMETQQRNFALALGVSLLIHAVVLSIHFKLPQALNRATEQALDVILVNSRSATKPAQAQAKAQANLDGGGNTLDPRRAQTPLPPSRQTREGDSLVEAQRRVAELEAQQRQMMTRLLADKSVAADPRHNEAAPPAPAKVSGLDLASSAMAIARLEAQIGRNLEEYNQRPRRKFLGARVAEYRFAQYVEDWRLKIERIGNLNYPESAKGRLYGSLVLTVVIRSDGSLERVEVNRPSGHRMLDEAAQRIVKMSAPFASFPEAIRSDTDIIEITRTWTFTNADRLSSD